MPNQYVNKVQLADGTVLLDLTSDTVASNKLVSGETAHDKSGNPVQGALNIQHYYTGSGSPPSSLGVDGDVYLQIDGNGGTGSYQAKSNIHPSASSQTVTADTGYDGLSSVQVNAVTTTNLTAANIKSGVVVKIGDSTDDDCVASITGSYEGSSGKNIQYATGRSEVSSASYIATDLSIQVSKAGTYKCYWSMDRNTTSGTTGSQLYKGSTALGSAHTSWTYNNNNRNGMNCEETLTFAKNDTITVRARSRSTSYICGVMNFFIVEQ